MKKLMVFGISIFLFMFLFDCISYASAIRINEVELNPEGTDSGKEWVELYSESEIGLSGWIIKNNNGKTMTFNASFSGYYIIYTPYLLLTNENQKLTLLNSNGNIIDETSFIEDKQNDDKTWQYCNEDWKFIESTKEKINSCEKENDSKNDEDAENGEEKQEPEIFLKLDWNEDEVVNGEEFEIKAEAYNLKDESYDIKVYIADKDNDTIISETYNEKDKGWIAGAYYVNGIVKGKGNKSDGFKLRIKSNYDNFKGEAEIIAKIRKTDNSLIIDEVKEDIEILEKEGGGKGSINKDDEKVKEEIKEEKNVEEGITSSVIRLGNKNKIQEQGKEQQDKSIVIYESSSEKIKKYAIYALNIFLIIIIIFLLISFKKNRIKKI